MMRFNAKGLVVGVATLVVAATASYANLLVHLEFENGPWNHDDPVTDSVGTLTGALMDNGASSTTWDNSATFGNALSINGSWQRVKFGTNGGPSVGSVVSDFTVATWVNPNSINANGLHLYASNNSGGVFNGYAFILKSDGTLALNTGTGGSSFEYSAPTSVAAGAWHHVALTFADAGGGNFDAKFYVDGTQAGATQSGTAVPSAWTSASVPAWGIGVSEPGLFGSSGQLDDWRLYDNVLDQSAIAGLMIPEPMSMTLLGLGGLVCVLYRKRR